MEEFDKIEDHIFEEFDDKQMIRDIDDKQLMVNDKMDDKFEYDRSDPKNNEGLSSGAIYEKEKEFTLENLSDKDVEKLVNYSEEKRKTDNFGYKFGHKVSGGDYSPNNFENKFEDYLKAPNISGNSKLRGNEFIIDKDKVVETGHTIEISDNSHKDKNFHVQSSVVINRDEKGEIENIQIICKCGEKILLNFDYAENDLVDLTSSEKQKVQKSIWSSDELISEGQKLAFQDKLFKDVVRESEEESLIKEMEVEKLIKDYEDFGLEKMLGLDASAKEINKKDNDKANEDDDDFFEEDIDFLSNDSNDKDEEVDFGDIDFSNI